MNNDSIPNSAIDWEKIEHHKQLTHLEWLLRDLINIVEWRKEITPPDIKKQFKYSNKRMQEIYDQIKTWFGDLLQVQIDKYTLLHELEKRKVTDSTLCENDKGYNRALEEIQVLLIKKSNQRNL